jgi:hypothetical protein
MARRILDRNYMGFVSSVRLPTPAWLAGFCVTVSFVTLAILNSNFFFRAFGCCCLPFNGSAVISPSQSFHQGIKRKEGKRKMC